jgi:hypothetical protein
MLKLNFLLMHVKFRHYHSICHNNDDNDIDNHINNSTNNNAEHDHKHDKYNDYASTNVRINSDNSYVSYVNFARVMLVSAQFLR